MNEIYRFFIRISAFLGREIFGVVRQPMLVLSLILGPFLILLLFGLGFRNEPQALRTLFVVDEKNDKMAAQLEEYVTSLGPQLIYMGVTDDQAEATRKLIRQEVDLVAVVPGDAYELIRNSQPVVIQLEHYEIDPFQIDYINVFGQVYVDEMNRLVLLDATQQGQQESTTAQDALGAARQSAQDLSQALEANDITMARQEQQSLDQDTALLLQTVGATVGVVGGVQQAMGVEANQNIEEVKDLLASIEEKTDSLNRISSASTNLEAEKDQVTKLEEDLSQLENLLGEFQDIEPDVLVRPFRSQTKSVAPVELAPSDFFAPAVIALLLQHLAVTLGAMSIVRERRDGTMELFRVSPISAIETLISKYLSYLLFTAILSFVLTLIVIYGLGVPMLGAWLNYNLVLLALIFTSLGFGFVISLIANSDTEAVQYSMIILLTSVFFSGAFIALQYLWAPVRVVSWAVPATYGIRLLQDIMLRGFLANSILLLGLAGIGVFLFLIAWWLMRRAMAQA